MIANSASIEGISLRGLISKKEKKKQYDQTLEVILIFSGHLFGGIQYAE